MINDHVILLCINLSLFLTKYIVFPFGSQKLSFLSMHKNSDKMTWSISLWTSLYYIIALIWKQLSVSFSSSFFNNKKKQNWKKKSKIPVYFSQICLFRLAKQILQVKEIAYRCEKENRKKICARCIRWQFGQWRHQNSGSREHKLNDILKSIRQTSRERSK